MICSAANDCLKHSPYFSNIRSYRNRVVNRVKKNLRWYKTLRERHLSSNNSFYYFFSTTTHFSLHVLKTMLSSHELSLAPTAWSLTVSTKRRRIAWLWWICRLYLHRAWPRCHTSWYCLGIQRYQTRFGNHWTCKRFHCYPRFQFVP